MVTMSVLDGMRFTLHLRNLRLDLRQEALSDSQREATMEDAGISAAQASVIFLAFRSELKSFPKQPEIDYMEISISSIELGEVIIATEIALQYYNRDEKKTYTKSTVPLPDGIAAYVDGFPRQKPLLPVSKTLGAAD